MSSGFQPPSKSSSSSSINSLASSHSPAWSTIPNPRKQPNPFQLLDESWNVHAFILEIKEEMTTIAEMIVHVESRLINTDQNHPDHAYLHTLLGDLQLSLADLEAKKARWTSQLKVVMNQRKAIKAEA